MSEISKYDYLKNDIYNKKNKNVRPFNSFYDFNLNEIQDMENKLGFEFPSQLKQFWQTMGYGFLRVSKNGEDPGLDNRILAPDEIAMILLDKEQAHESGLMLIDIAEELHPGDMPFFHVANSSHFLFMKPESENSNAVYDIIGGKVEDNFETFIYRLYHESPKYYLNLDDEK